MEAIFIEKYGAPEVLRQRTVDPKSPGPGEVRIQVKASGVNFADLLQRLHLYGNAPKLPYVLGFEISGTVLETGSGVSELNIGDRVACLTRFGGYAEEVCVAQNVVQKVPEEISLEQAAAVPVNYLTAWFCLFNMGNLKKGERVLIQTGAGGVGCAAIHLSRSVGAEIFATTSSEEKIKFLRSEGVAHPINYNTCDFETEVNRLTGGEGVDVVIDAIGGEALRKGYNLLSPLGRLVSYGLSAAAPGPGRNLLKTVHAVLKTPRFKPLDLIQRNVGVYGFHLALLKSKEHLVKEAFAEILSMICRKEFSPVIAETFPLTAAGAAQAHRYLHERRNIGKVLLVS